MNKTEKENYNEKKVYCLFNEKGEKILIGKVKFYLGLSYIKTAMKKELALEINYNKFHCEISGKKFNEEKVIQAHRKRYKKIKIVEYELKQVKEINSINLIE